MVNHLKLLAAKIRVVKKIVIDTASIQLKFSKYKKFGFFIPKKEMAVIPA